MTFNFRFYLLRLRYASPFELIFRIRQWLALTRLKRSAARRVPIAPSAAMDALARIRTLQMPDLIVEDASRLLDLMEPSTSAGQPIFDRYDTQAMKSDIRIRWEPARLQKASALIVRANQYPSVPDSQQVEQRAEILIVDWLDAHPFLIGEHYSSAMECALRIPVFFYALKRLNGLSASRQLLVLTALHHHGQLVYRRLSLYSSLGNHTITEAVGLLFAGAVFRSTHEGKRWLDAGIDLLNDEVHHQILTDGGPAEQSLSYHRFIIDLCCLALDFIRKNRLAGDLDLAWMAKLSAGERFLDAFCDKHGRLPAIGDDDGGVAVAPGLKPLRPNVDEPTTYGTSLFENAGYAVIRSGDLLFTFDYGPLGMPPLYNHGHADALSITLSLDGQALLVDPGTYRYNGVPDWRRYFKGTRAHNTVTIDGRDQAFQETGFIWRHPYRVERTAYRKEGDELFITAFHDGYAKAKKPVRHFRSILFYNRLNFVIKDRFTGTGEHDFQLNYHLHPNVVVTSVGRWLMLENGDAQLYMGLSEGSFDQVKGEEDPIMGWYSSRYGEKEPTTVLTHTQMGRPMDIVFTTLIFSLNGSSMARPNTGWRHSYCKGYGFA